MVLAQEQAGWHRQMGDGLPHSYPIRTLTLTTTHPQPHPHPHPTPHTHLHQAGRDRQNSARLGEIEMLRAQIREGEQVGATLPYP